MALGRSRAVVASGVGTAVRMSPQRGSSPELARLSVVVIARNEERHIGACLEALIRALTHLPGTPLLLVDSGSTDRTVEIARGYEISIYSYAGPVLSAAAGRRIGFERTTSRWVLFIDGDCCVEPDWIELALDMIERNPQAAVIYGTRREVFECANEHAHDAAPTGAEYGLGGNALYRASALHAAGGFDPYLKAGEEAELLGRIMALGYSAIAMPDLMFTHHTLAKTTISGFTARLRRGLAHGLGQTLRLAITQGLFLYHARRLNRVLLTFAFLLGGAVVCILGLITGKWILPAIWLVSGALAFATLCFTRRSVRSAAFIVADWVSTAIPLPIDFLRTPPDRNCFAPEVRVLSCNSSTPLCQSHAPAQSLID
jgi:glycosyl transferase family 2